MVSNISIWKYSQKSFFFLYFPLPACRNKSRGHQYTVGFRCHQRFVRIVLSLNSSYLLLLLLLFLCYCWAPVMFQISCEMFMILSNWNCRCVCVYVICSWLFTQKISFFIGTLSVDNIMLRR